MGSLTFLLPDPVPSVAQTTLQHAFFATVMGVTGTSDMAPVPTEVAISPGKMIVTRNVTDSGFLVVPWPVGSLGTLVVSTSTLRETDEPYRLLVELARGKLNQVRTQCEEWKLIGLRPSSDFEDRLAETTRLFARAIHGPTPAETDEAATRVLEQSSFLADSLVRDFIEQMFETRQHEDGRLETRLAARVSPSPYGLNSEYVRAFNAVQLAVRWRDIEPEETQYHWADLDAAVAAAKAADLPITIGPVIDISPGMLPNWAAGWENDLPTLAAFMCDFLETVLTRYKGEVQRWVICAGFNHAESLGLDDDDRLRLAFRLFEAAAQIDPSLELVLSVSQPWGDYLVNENHTIAPLTFPDDLVRAGVKLSGLEVELRVGTVPRGSLPRDLLETSRIINLFGILQLPLEITLSLPSSTQPDPIAKSQGQTVWSPATWDITPDGQAEWGASFAALALCFPHVRAVTWDHWSDLDPHLSPHGGLLDPTGKPKPLLSRLRTLRSAYLR